MLYISVILMKDKTMETNRILLVTVVCVMVLCCSPRLAFGDADQHAHATCAISVTVDSIIEWEAASFAAIDLDTQEGHIIAQGTSPEGTATLSLWINCNVALSANNAGTTAQLTHTVGTTDYLVTKYYVTFDGAGVTDTGPLAADVVTSGSGTLAVHTSFLSTPLPITHINTDGRVEVTLHVEATNDTDNAADVGLYQATQTLTATWVSDN
jgi:hypothetical protein